VIVMMMTMTMMTMMKISVQGKNRHWIKRQQLLKTMMIKIPSMHI